MLSMRQRHQQYHKKPLGGGQVKKLSISTIKLSVGLIAGLYVTFVM